MIKWILKKLTLQTEMELSWNDVLEINKIQRRKTYNEMKNKYLNFLRKV